NTGDVLGAVGKREEALQPYRHSLAILERLATIDRSNTQWQQNLANAYVKVSGVLVKIGDALVAQGKLDEALKAYRDAFAVAERLIANDPNNTQWQRGMASLHEKTGDVLVAQRILEEAL